MISAEIATIAGDAEIDYAIATLALAFGADPVARWMYHEPNGYLCISLTYSARLEKARLKQVQRTALATALA
jgi:hypothetical protein